VIFVPFGAPFPFTELRIHLKKPGQTPLYTLRKQVSEPATP